MPNCDYYGTIEDHERILSQLLKWQECEIYELSSALEKPLKRFYDVDSILSEFDKTYKSGKKVKAVYLQLFVLECGFEFKPKKIKLDPKKCDGFTFRYTADNFGLIQLYLEIPEKKSLNNSHTNHNSEKRAKVWAKSDKEKKEVEFCDFKKITKFSSKLNRLIRKDSIGNISSRPVLKGAYELWTQGYSFGPYNKENHELSKK